MRRIVLAGAALVAALAPAATAASTTPAIRLVTQTPLVVAGSHFKPIERVTVSAGSIRHIVRTTAAGTFRAEFGQVSFDRCSTRVVAVGARGDRAVLPGKPMCPPA